MKAAAADIVKAALISCANEAATGRPRPRSRRDACVPQCWRMKCPISSSACSAGAMSALNIWKLCHMPG